MTREIVLDTETTGLDPRSGHRLIEVGCVEIDDLLPTGRTYHCFVNPERLIDPDAIRVHGITDEQVRDAPRFADMCHDLLEFIGEAPVIAHNAAFDRGFLNHELGLCGRAILGEVRWIDTLALAQRQFPGASNSLDALCRRFRISLSERALHGALIDARLLASVYLELKGGKERALNFTQAVTKATGAVLASATVHGARPRPLAVGSSWAERQRHLAFLNENLPNGSLWFAYGLSREAT